MMVSRSPSRSSFNCSSSTPIIMLLLLCPVASSFLHPIDVSIRQQQQSSSSVGVSQRRPITIQLNQTPKIVSSTTANDSEGTANEGKGGSGGGTSKRAQRKAAQRLKKERSQQQKSSRSNINKETSQHPEAIIKRQNKNNNNNNNSNNGNGGNGRGGGKRRNHNFAQRIDYLTEGSQDDVLNADINVVVDYPSTVTSSSSSSSVGGSSIRGNSGTNNNNDNGNNSNNISHQLHSRSISKLDINTKPDDVVKAIKRAQNLHDVHDIVEIAHFLLEEVDQSFAYGYRGSLLSRLAVASLHLSNYNIAERCIIERRTVHRSSMLPLESAAIIRGLLRCHHTIEAWEVLEDELSLPLDAWTLFDGDNTNNNNNSKNGNSINDNNSHQEVEEEDGELHLEEETTRRRLEARDKLIHRARSIASIASRHFYEMEPTHGIQAIMKLKEMGKLIIASGLTADMVGVPWDRLVKGAALCEKERRDGKWDDVDDESEKGDDDNAAAAEDPSIWPCNIVYTVLDAMISFPSENKDVTFEALCNALVRRTVFVTGAVDMDGCPDADRGEVAFIGRSNVGKSSLVNMLTNRKSLAFTSKTPGKTQQFNYFAVNDKPELERQIRYGDDVPGTKDRDSFYIVDLPGFGFAKVPQQQRQQWSDFMDEYLQERQTLQAVFHLIDARHGPTEEDGKIMQKVGTILGQKQQAKVHCAKYIIILTKADKNVKNAKSQSNPGKVSNKVMEKLRQTMNENRVGYAPIVLTSSETRLGRDEVWKYLRFAAEL